MRRLTFSGTSTLPLWHMTSFTLFSGLMTSCLSWAPPTSEAAVPAYNEHPGCMTHTHTYWILFYLFSIIVLYGFSLNYFSRGQCGCVRTIWRSKRRKVTDDHDDSITARKNNNRVQLKLSSLMTNNNSNCLIQAICSIDLIHSWIGFGLGWMTVTHFCLITWLLTEYMRFMFN